MQNGTIDGYFKSISFPLVYRYTSKNSIFHVFLYTRFLALVLLKEKNPAKRNEEKWNTFLENVIFKLKYICRFKCSFSTYHPQTVVDPKEYLSNICWFMVIGGECEGGKA